MSGFDQMPPGTVLVLFDDGSAIVRGDGSDEEREALLALLIEQSTDPTTADSIVAIMVERGLTMVRRADPTLVADPRVISGDKMEAIAGLLAAPSWPLEFPPSRQMSRESFEALLIEVRNGAQLAITERALDAVKRGEQNDAVMADARAVWHATEVTIGVLRPGYVPKREALDDARRMLAWLDEGDDTWLDTD
jgi:hypothetical protein